MVTKDVDKDGVYAAVVFRLGHWSYVDFAVNSKGYEYLSTGYTRREANQESAVSPLERYLGYLHGQSGNNEPLLREWFDDAILLYTPIDLLGLGHSGRKQL